MARVVDALPAKRSGKRGTEFPWEEWLDGRVWELTAGEDFQSKIDSFRSSAGSAGQIRGFKVLTRVNEEKTKLYIQAVRNGRVA